jgi:hypothetical protein
MELRSRVSLLAIKTEEGISESAAAPIRALKRREIKNNMAKITLRSQWVGERALIGYHYENWLNSTYR